MDLERSLTSIRAVADLPRLVLALGHQPIWEEVPRQAWARGVSGNVMAVGRTGALPWFAVECIRPGEVAARIAGRLSRRGRISLVFALDPNLKRLALAVAFDRVPRLEVDVTRPDRESIASLARLVGVPEGGTMAFAARAAEALSAETVGRRFFLEFRDTLRRIAAGIREPALPDDRQSLALLQLTRILFLYFIQSKGWLAGRPRFLAEEVDRCLSRNRRIHRDLLRPLFFGTLNQPDSERGRTARAFGPIPFLNGGLFEPHPLERRFRADLSNPLLRDAFDRLFERFHFTVSERSGSGVAPDMLGRVFEGLMAPADRHASGTFYTPASLVDQLFETALITSLSARLGCPEAEAERRIQEGEHRAADMLLTLTVLDPAVGSGAFLLGALERLAGHNAPGQALLARRRHVLSHNLFGVDRSATAVRLAELRLWLAVIAGDPADHAGSVSPLPNLDCLIRQGDSLFEPLGEIRLDAAHESGLIRELRRVRQELISASGTSKRLLIRQLRRLEARALGASLAATEARHRTLIAESLQHARSCDLFGQRHGLDRASRSEVARLRSQLHRVRQARRTLARDGELPWFHYQSQFADVFARGGFDIVVGNPPWLRFEKIPSLLRSRLAGRYRWWRSSTTSYHNGPDLSVAFLERGLELAAPGGVLAMLVPAKIKSAGYGSAVRHGLATNATLHVVADLTGHAMSEVDAVVYPMALVASKRLPAETHHVHTAFSRTSNEPIPQARFRGGSPWILASHQLQDIVAELGSAFPSLSDSIVCHLGLKTGANRVFLDPPELEPEVMRWALRGRDLRAFEYRCRTRLLWTHDARGCPRRSLPPRAAAYLDSFRSELLSRRDFRGGIPWTVFRARPVTARHRVVWADLARQLTAVALVTRRDRNHIPLNSCYVAPVASKAEAERLCAWLNSSPIRAIARLLAMPAASGFARFNAQTVVRLPLPEPVLQDGRLSRLARAARAKAPVQEELDTIAVAHLGLSLSSQNALRQLVESRPAHCR